MARLILILALLWLLAACQSTANPTPPGVIGEVTRPELVDVIQWERSPDSIVFRAEVAGGDIDTAFYARNDIAYCTIYGDNRVVWTTTTTRTDDGVVFDLISDEAIRVFVDRLTNEDRLYDFKTGVDLLTPSDARPVFERLTLFVNDQLHQTDSFGGWDFAFFQQILEACRSISTTPITFAPDAAWIAAQEIDYNPDRPSIIWDGNATGLRLAELASGGERRWLTGQNVVLLWEAIRSGGADLQFTDETATYLVAVEVPGITRSSPPAPAQ